MPAVSETMVREYFELNEFLVRQHRKHVGQSPGGHEDDIDFFVANPRPARLNGPLPFVIGTADLRHIEHAVVVVKGWHTGSFSPAVLENSPEIFRFVEPKVFQSAVEAFADKEPPLKILVVPALPHQRGPKEESIKILKAKGIDAVILFRTILVDLINKTETNRNYQKSDLLQIIRILKTYELVGPQMELFKPVRRRKPKPSPPARPT